MSQASQLYQLQCIDKEIDEYRLRIDEIEQIIANDSEIINSMQLRDESQAKYQRLFERISGLEKEVEAARIKLEVNSASLYNGRIQNPKELRDLQTEVASNKKRLSSLEDSLFDLMIELEEAEKNLKAASHLLEQTKNNHQGKASTLLLEKDSLLKKIENLEDQKPLVVNSITEENLTVYQKLRTTRRGVAVAAIEDNTCSACGAPLTPSQRQLTHSPTQLVYCSSCGRILYAR